MLKPARRCDVCSSLGAKPSLLLLSLPIKHHEIYGPYTVCQFIKHMKYDKAEKVCEEEAQEDDVQGPNHQLICNY